MRRWRTQAAGAAWMGDVAVRRSGTMTFRPHANRATVSVRRIRSPGEVISGQRPLDIIAQGLFGQGRRRPPRPVGARIVQRMVPSQLIPVARSHACSNAAHQRVNRDRFPVLDPASCRHLKDIPDQRAASAPASGIEDDCEPPMHLLKSIAKNPLGRRPYRYFKRARNSANVECRGRCFLVVRARLQFDA